MTVLTTIDLRWRLFRCRPALPAETYGCYIDILRTQPSPSAKTSGVPRETPFVPADHDARQGPGVRQHHEAAGVGGVFARNSGPTMHKQPPHRWAGGDHRRRVGPGSATTAPMQLDDVTMAVSLDIFGPSLFVIASEREGGIDLSIGYAAYAMAESEVQWLTQAAPRQPGSKRLGEKEAGRAEDDHQQHGGEQDRQLNRIHLTRKSRQSLEPTP